MSTLAPHQRARELRAGRDFNETARDLGISSRQLRRIESGELTRGPNGRTLRAFHRVFGEDPWAAQRVERGLDHLAVDERQPNEARLELGRRLRARRKELGLKQSEVAERGQRRWDAYSSERSCRHPERQYLVRAINLSTATVSRWERGYIAKASEISEALALALEADHEEWFGPRRERWRLANLPKFLLDDLPS